MSYNYIISAEEKEEAKEKIEEIRKSIKLDFDYSEYDLEEDGLYPIIDELTTISLFDNPKFIVINSSENIIKANDKAFVELLTAMNSQENDNVLVFIGFSAGNVGYFNFTTLEPLRKVLRFQTLIGYIRADSCSAERCEVCAAPQSLSDVAGKRTYVSSFAAMYSDSYVRHGIFQQLYAVYMYGFCSELHFFSLSSQMVSVFTVHFACGIDRRSLKYVALEFM